MTRDELDNKMAVLLGGRAAEDVIFGHLSTGAADDLAKVTDIARSMVMRYAMVEGLGHVAYEEERAPFLGGRCRRPTESTAKRPPARSMSRCAASSSAPTRSGGDPAPASRRARELGAEAAREGNARRDRARRAAPAGGPAA